MVELWSSSIDAISNEITVYVSSNGKDLHKKLKKQNKNFRLPEEKLIKDFYFFELYKNFYKRLEVPFSAKDRKQIHKAIYEGLIQNDPELEPSEALIKIELLSEFIKEFIALNRLFVENETYNYFDNQIINFQINILLEKYLPSLNDFTIIFYLYTILYSSHVGLLLLEKKLHDDVYGVSELGLKKLLNRKSNLELPSKFNKYLDKDKEEIREIQKLSHTIRHQFERLSDRYATITRLSSFLDNYLEYNYLHSSYKPVFSKDELMVDLFDTFTLDEQSKFVKSILNQADISNVIETAGAVSFEAKAMHEFYKRNHPSLHLLGDDGVTRNILQKGNYRVKIKKVTRISEHDIENKLDLARILSFQTTFGVPVLVPIDDEDYYYYEYKILYHDKRKVRYRRFSKFFTIPDILEVYIDNTGSMYWAEDEDYVGFNDGSRRDMSLSVIYALIEELYREASKQHKKCFIRLHSFSEEQISSDLIPIDDFMTGINNSTLKVLFNPDNGHHFENLDVMVPENDNLKRVIIVITDGDLVLEGRTEREASKLALLSKNPLTQVILFEMEQHFSLGKAIASNKKIHSYSVKDKDQMFYQGIDVILENNTRFNA